MEHTATCASKNRVSRFAVLIADFCNKICRFCCKSLFALAIKISFGCPGDFHVNMWGTSLSEEKLAGDPGNVIEATSIGGRRSDFFTAGKLAPGNFGLLQQYRHFSEVTNEVSDFRLGEQSRLNAIVVEPPLFDPKQTSARVQACEAS